MKRHLRLLGVTALLAVTACGDDVQPASVRITLFAAASDAIEMGQSTKLFFAVEPSTAGVNITGVGDVTGKTDVSITPTATTTYQLVATLGAATDQRSVTVTVGPKQAVAIKVEPATATPTAGEPLSVVVTAIAATGVTAPGFRGTVHLTSSDAGAELPSDFAFVAADAGVKTVSVKLKTAGVRDLVASDV